MRRVTISGKLSKKLSKLKSRNKAAYLIIKAKMNGVAKTDDPHHYKNLRAPLNKYKAVHVLSSFVILFKYDNECDSIEFVALEHHDNVYEKR